MTVAIGKFVGRADAALSDLDKKTLIRLEKQLQSEYNKLEAELRKLYNTADTELSDSSRAFKEQRARMIMEQLSQLLQLLSGDKTEKLIDSHINDVFASELTQTHELLRAFGAAQMSQIPIETIAAVVSNISDNLAHHGAEFALAAEDVVVSGLINGHGFGKMATNLRNKLGILKWKAQTIVRTETMQASDLARRTSYRDNGIEYVMRIATQDNRVCGFCLARAGNVYRVEDAPQSLHPNDRCYNAPFKPEWEELGLIDTDWVLSHRQDAEKRSEDTPKTGRAPFEKSADIDPPKPVWVPGKGYTEHYKP